MELKISKNNLLNLLRWSQGIVDKRSPMLILSNILLEVSEGILKTTATDLEVVVSTEGPIEGKGKGRWVVHAKNLFEIIREAPTEEIKLSGQEGGGLELISGKARFKIVGMNPDDFPNLPPLSTKMETTLDPANLSDMIESTFYAVSTDETRYTLNGLYLITLPGAEPHHGDTNRLRLVATDGHRLSYSEREVDKKWRLDKGILIPRKGIQEIKKLLTEGEGDLQTGWDDKSIRFRRGSVSLTVRLIEGEFPSYEQVIPKKLERIVSVGRETLAGSLKRASILTAAEGRGVKFKFSPNILEVSSAHTDLGETQEEIVVDYRGPKFEVAFNPRYLMDVLAVLEDEKVVLELKDDVSPCVIRSEFDRGFLALVMPMRV